MEQISERAAAARICPRAPCSWRSQLYQQEQLCGTAPRRSRSPLSWESLLPWRGIPAHPSAPPERESSRDALRAKQSPSVTNAVKKKGASLNMVKSSLSRALSLWTASQEAQKGQTNSKELDSDNKILRTAHTRWKTGNLGKPRLPVQRLLTTHRG